MKTKILSILLTVAAMLGFCACDNGLDPQPQAQGQLKLSSMAVEVDEAENVISRAGVNTDNFIVVIKNTAGEIFQLNCSFSPPAIWAAAGFPHHTLLIIKKVTTRYFIAYSSHFWCYIITNGISFL